MPHSRISIAGALRLHRKNIAAYGSEMQPQMGGALRLRHAALHLSCACLLPPLQVGHSVMRGSRRRWSNAFPKLQGDGSRVPPRIETHI